MTGKQYLFIFICLIISIFLLITQNYFTSIISFLIVGILINIFEKYNNYKEKEIEKEIYNEIKARKKERD